MPKRRTGLTMAAKRRLASWRRTGGPKVGSDRGLRSGSKVKWKRSSRVVRSFHGKDAGKIIEIRKFPTSGRVKRPVPAQGRAALKIGRDIHFTETRDISKRRK